MEDGASTNGTLDVTFKRSVPISIFFPKQDDRFLRDDITYSLSDLCKRPPMRVKEQKRVNTTKIQNTIFFLCCSGYSYNTRVSLFASAVVPSIFIDSLSK